MRSGLRGRAAHRLLFALLLGPLLSACASTYPRVLGAPPPAEVNSLTLVAHFSIPSGGRYPPTIGLPFGGISSLARVSEQDILGVSDGRFGGRIYRFRFENLDTQLQVRIVGIVSLEIPPGVAEADHEGVVVLPNSDLLLAAEGTGREPRRPPTLTEYGRYGQYQRTLAIPDKFVPEVTGLLTRGARGNASFESLTVTPDGDRLFTGTETALVQDGAPASFEAGTWARILEYRSRNDSYEPGAEYVYPVERIDRPSYTPGIAINGLVELLALNRSTLLALERAYVEDAGQPGSGGNQIRLFRVSLTGATDVSGLDSLKNQAGITPVTKTLLLDLSEAAGLPSELLPRLDNFEGMTFGPRLPDGRPTLVLVSDDNFNASQRTWFLMFAIE